MNSFESRFEPESLGMDGRFRYKVRMSNPALNAAVIAAAQEQAASAKAIKDQLTKAGATSPRSPTSLDLSINGSGKMLEYMVKQGHVRDAGGGRYWLDEEAVARSTANSKRVALIVAVFLLSLAASLWAILLNR